MSAALGDRGVELPTLPTLVGLTASPGFQNFRVYPFSISPEDGISAAGAVMRIREPFINCLLVRHQFPRLISA